MEHSTSNQPLPDLSTRDTGTSATSELIVVIFPANLGFTEFVGTRAMLEDEGIIPAGTEWPAGFDDLRWKDGQFHYWLDRKRPTGAKGPRKNFAECDWWCLRQTKIDEPSPERRAIQRKEQELRDEIYRQSAKGRAEHAKNWMRHEAARKDEAFQAFKALVPGLVRPKRGRPRKNAASN